jgi:hypothetical protein
MNISSMILAHHGIVTYKCSFKAIRCNFRNNLPDRVPHAQKRPDSLVWGVYIGGVKG